MVPFIDMHCDTLTQANMHFQHDVYQLPLEMLDVVKLKKGGAKVQFFAVCLPKITTVRTLGSLYEGDWKHIRRLAGILHNTCNLHPDHIALCRSIEDLEKNEAAGRISAILTIEDGRDINGDMKRLELYHRLGVRLITLTWNFENCFGYPNTPGGKFVPQEMMDRGLSSFGKDAIGEMNRLGILIDVSHLSDGGFRDVAQLSDKPFVASHSNCRAICSHPRNLTDEMIRTLAEKGGVMGLNQYPLFLYNGATESRVEDYLAHINHMRDVGGIGCIALGSDFDGIGRSCRPKMKGPQDYPKLANLLLDSGYTEDEVDRIFYKNAERVLREVLG